MRLMFNGKEYFGPRGPAGPDGSPIGTIISYMGKTAPKDYLVCDGSVYALSDYSELARFFTKQFGSSNYFGGDGVTTFAVPDMRNLFLRGYHGEGEEQLSGDIGVKQEATVIPGFESGYGTFIRAATASDMWNRPKNQDTILESVSDVGIQTSYAGASISVGYTARPVNMAILYCIKAAESFQAQDIYSEEERRIGTWIDGKPLYQKVITIDFGVEANNYVIAENVDTFAHANGMAIAQNGRMIGLPNYVGANDGISFLLANGKLTIKETGYTGYKIRLNIQYTKTTDQAAIEPAAVIQGGISL